MTSKAAHRKGAPKVKYVSIHKLANGVALLALIILIVAGMLANVSFPVIAFRATVVYIVVAIVSRVVISILTAYEEMNSGEA